MGDVQVSEVFFDEKVGYQEQYYEVYLPADAILPIPLHKKDRGRLSLIYTALHDLQNAVQSPHQIHGTSSIGHNHNILGTYIGDHENCPEKMIQFLFPLNKRNARNPYAFLL